MTDSKLKLRHSRKSAKYISHAIYSKQARARVVYIYIYIYIYVCVCVCI